MKEKMGFKKIREEAELLEEVEEIPKFFVKGVTIKPVF